MKTNKANSKKQTTKAKTAEQENEKEIKKAFCINDFVKEFALNKPLYFFGVKMVDTQFGKSCIAYFGEKLKDNGNWDEMISVFTGRLFERGLRKIVKSEKFDPKKPLIVRSFKHKEYITIEYDGHIYESVPNQISLNF